MLSIYTARNFVPASKLKKFKPNIGVRALTGINIAIIKKMNCVFGMRYAKPIE